MKVFNLWSPYVPSPGVVEVDVTRGEFARVADGTAEFAREALNAVGVRGTPGEWTAVPFRTPFYSDYTDDPEWGNRWTVGWTLRVRVAEPVSEVAQPHLGLPISLDAFDTSWRQGQVDPRHDATALLVAVVGDAGLGGKVDAHLRSACAARFPGSRPVAQQRELPGGLRQIRLLLGGVEFPEAAEPLEAVLSEARAMGAAVNWNQVNWTK